MYLKRIYTDALTESQIRSLVDYWYGTAKTVRRGWYHHIDSHGGRTSVVSAIAAASAPHTHRDKLLLHSSRDHVDMASRYSADGLTLLDGFIDATVGDGGRMAYGAYFNYPDPYPDPSIEREEAEAGYWGVRCLC